MTLRHERSWSLVAALLAAGCGPSTVAQPTDATSATGDAALPDAANIDDVDDSAIVSAVYPAALGCGEVATAHVVVRNTGTSTWTTATGYSLGAVDDNDPLHPDSSRVPLPGPIGPGETASFDIGLIGPPGAGAFRTDWRMVREEVHWFGATSDHDVVGTCGGDAIDLATAVVLNSPPDVASWIPSARITRLDTSSTGGLGGGGGVYLEFTKKDGPDRWPDVPFGGIPGNEPLQYTLWMVVNIDGQWFTSGGIQFWYAPDLRNGGPASQYAMNWYYDPNRWGPMTTHQPAAGETVGFFVTAGDQRNIVDHSGSPVDASGVRMLERSNVIVVPFPTDADTLFTFP